MLKNSIGKDAVKLTTAKMIGLMISMISAILLSHFTTLEEYGTYSQIIMVVSLAVSIFTLGLTNSINYFLASADTDKEKSTFLSTYFYFNTLLCIIMGLILALVTPLFAKYFYNDGIRSFFYVLAILPWATVFDKSIDNVLIVYQKTTKLMVYRCLNSLALLLIIVLVQVMNLTFAHYMMLLVIVQACSALWIYGMAGNLAGRMRVFINWPLVKNILAFSIPLGLSAILGTFTLQLDKLMIGHFMGTKSLAIYTNSGRELPITIIASSLTAVLMPRLVRLLKQNKYFEAIQLWGDVTVLSYIVISFFATAFIVFAPQVITFLYSAKYLPGVSVFCVFNMILLMRTTYFGIILNSMGKTKFIMYSSIAALGLNVALNFLFYQLLGFVGPAVATFLSIALVDLAQLYASAKSVQVSFKDILPWKQLGLITLVNIGAGAVAAGILHGFRIGTTIKDILIVIGIGLVWMGLYTTLMLKTINSKWRAINTAALLQGGT